MKPVMFLMYFLSVMILTMKVMASGEMLEELKNHDRLEIVFVYAPIIVTAILLSPYLVIALIPVQTIGLINKYADIQMG